MSIFTSFFQWISGQAIVFIFFSKSAEIAIVGLQASGKTSFVNVIGSGQWSEDVVPTVGFIFRKVLEFTHDPHSCFSSHIGSQGQRYTQDMGRCGPTQVSFNVGALLPRGRRDSVSPLARYRPDAHQTSPSDLLSTRPTQVPPTTTLTLFLHLTLKAEKFNTARFELHQLLSQSALGGVPLLVLGNKNDLDGHVPVKDLIRDLQLDKIMDRPVSCYSCSMKSQHNLDIVLQWLSGRSH
ncbi:hypothetical protein HMN09_01248400 [Mycena chlorophos]|uniref:Uncharacterized protein n=1 Tax=Mycena chlorophos TaxID=658473 RepID=A0A8H6VVF6_MYCCL|nr:hypothetical protein HMN09_01248400 [Mycena chlorophos]